MNSARFIILFLVGVIIVTWGMTGCRRYPAMTETEILHPVPETSESEASLPDVVIEEPEGAVVVLELEEYIIGPEDVVEIKVWDHDDLTREVAVSQRGSFSFPLIGQVSAAGLTPAQLEVEIITLLADGYLVNPQVTVTVKEFKSQKVHIIGEVKEAGTSSLGGPTTVLEILSMAGGVTERAGTEVLVIRPQEGSRRGGPVTLAEAKESEVMRLSLEAIEKGQVSQNIHVLPGDTVYVPRAKYFYVVGEVGDPGQYKYESDITVLKAISIAGGVTEIGAANRVTVIREDEETRQEIPVDLNDPILPNDIIMVPESYF